MIPVALALWPVEQSPGGERMNTGLTGMDRRDVRSMLHAGRQYGHTHLRVTIEGEHVNERIATVHASFVAPVTMTAPALTRMIRDNVTALQLQYGGWTADGKRDPRVHVREIGIKAVDLD